MAAPKKPAAPKTTAVVARAKVALPAEVQEKMAADIAAFQGRMNAPTGNRIAVTQDRKFRDPAGDKHDSLRGVVVDFIAKKAWYEGAFDKDNIVPPNCFAMDFAPHNSLEPSDNSPDKQHDTCSSCPKNAFKSADNGKGKACKDAYILALLPPDADASNCDLMTLELSATAIKPFEKYVRDLARDFGKAPYAFVTEFYMDESVDYASVRCGNPEDADPALVALALSKREEAAQLLSKEPDVSDFEEKVAGKTKLPAAKGGAKRQAVRR